MAKYCTIIYEDGKKRVVEVRDDNIQKAYESYITDNGTPGGKFKVINPFDTSNTDRELLIDFRKVREVRSHTG